MSRTAEAGHCRRSGNLETTSGNLEIRTPSNFEINGGVEERERAGGEGRAFHIFAVDIKV